MHPLRSIWHPERDLVARLDAQRDEATRNGINVARELTEGETFLFEDEGLARSITRGPLIHQ